MQTTETTPAVETYTRHQLRGEHHSSSFVVRPGSDRVEVVVTTFPSRKGAYPQTRTWNVSKDEARAIYRRHLAEGLKPVAPFVLAA